MKRMRLGIIGRAVLGLTMAASGCALDRAVHPTPNAQVADAMQTLKVESVRLLPAPGGGYVEGDVVNDSDRAFQNVSVGFSLFDGSGQPCQPMDSTNDTTAAVAPRSRWSFHCPLYGIPAATCRLRWVL